MKRQVLACFYMCVSSVLFASDATIEDVVIFERGSKTSIVITYSGTERLKFFALDSTERLFSLDLPGVFSHFDFGTLDFAQVDSVIQVPLDPDVSNGISVRFLLREGVNYDIFESENRLTLFFEGSLKQAIAAVPVLDSDPAEVSPVNQPLAPSTRNVRKFMDGPKRDHHLYEIAVDASDKGGRLFLTMMGMEKFNHFFLDTPNRFVLDLQGIVLEFPGNDMQLDHPLVDRVRIRQFQSFPKPITRLVLDLAGNAHVSVQKAEQGLIVAFASNTVHLAELMAASPDDELRLDSEQSIEQDVALVHSESDEPIASSEPTESVASSEPAEIDEPIASSEPAEIDASSEPAEIDEPVASSEPAEIDASSEPAEIDEPVASSEPAEIDETVASSEPAEIDASSEPAEIDEPVASSEPAEIDETVASSEPAEIDEPVASSEPAEIDETVASSEPAEIDETVTSSESAEIDEPVASSEPAEIDEPVASNEPAEIDEPIASFEPADSVASNEPAEIDETVASSEPAEINEPIASFEPADSVASSEPAEIDEPVASSEPAEIDEPVVSSEPAEINEPIASSEPAPEATEQPLQTPQNRPAAVEVETDQIATIEHEEEPAQQSVANQTEVETVETSEPLPLDGLDESPIQGDVEPSPFVMASEIDLEMAAFIKQETGEKPLHAQMEGIKSTRHDIEHVRVTNGRIAARKQLGETKNLQDEDPLGEGQDEPFAELFESKEDAFQSVGGEEEKYRGFDVMIDIREQPVLDLLRFLADEVGFNLYVDSSVKSNVTATYRFRNIPWDQALDIILTNANLAKEFRNGVLRVATTEKFRAEEAARLQLRQQRELSVPTETVTVDLNYARARDIVPIVSEYLSPRGSIIRDDRTNILIIRDIPKYMVDIRTLINRLDKRIPQVSIEARIVETSTRFLRELGIQWGLTAQYAPETGTNTGVDFPHRIALGGPRIGQARSALTGPEGGYAVNLPAISENAVGVGLTLGNFLDNFKLDISMQLLESEGQGQIISSPKVTTQNNRTAVITSGQRIPIQTIQRGTVTTRFIDAVLELQVTPQITADETIIMDLLVDKSEPDFTRATGAGGNPIINVSRAETQVLVKNGGTAVIGGIFTLNEQLSETGVPTLRKVPVLRRLFSSQSKQYANQELLIFVTPKIVKY